MNWMDRLSVTMMRLMMKIRTMMRLAMKIMTVMRRAIATIFTVNELMTMCNQLLAIVLAIGDVSLIRLDALAVISFMLFVTIAQISTIRFVVDLMLTIA